jgi:hypothetical protein
MLLTGHIQPRTYPRPIPQPLALLPLALLPLYSGALAPANVTLVVPGGLIP